MTRRVLELNADYTALKLVNWKDALTKVFKETAYVVEYYDDWVVKDSADREYQIPSIIALKTFWASSNSPAKCSRRHLRARDMRTCQYCKKELKKNKDCTVDHVIPTSRWEALGNEGSSTCWENIVLSCEACNTIKADKTCKEADMFPVTKPKVPTKKEIWTKEILLENNPPDNWKIYLESIL